MTGTKCRGICSRLDEGFVKSSSYRDGRLKKCSICDAYLKNSFDRCPCCHNRLSNKSKSTKDKRSKKGDIAFLFFDMYVSRTNHEIQLLPKCYRFPTLGVRVMEHILDYFGRAVSQYEIIESEKRQRPEYLDTKRKILRMLKDKIILKTKEYWKKTANFQ